MKATFAVAAATAAAAFFASAASSKSERIEPRELIKQSEAVPGLTVTALPLTGRQDSHNVEQVSFLFSNSLSTEMDLDVSAIGGSAMVSRRMTVAPGATLRSDFAVPCFENWATQYISPQCRLCGTGFSIVVTRHGEGGGTHYRLDMDCIENDDNPFGYSVLAGAETYTASVAAKFQLEEAEYEKSHPKSSGSRPIGGALPDPSAPPSVSFNVLDADSPAWCADWRAYAGYDAVLLSDAEWRALAPGARLALADYVAVGGSLALTGGEGLPREISAISTRDGKDRDSLFGYGSFTRLPPAEQGPGSRFSVSRDRLVEILKPAKASLSNSFGVRLDALDALLAMPGFELPGLPVSASVSIVAAFAVMVLVAIWWFGRHERRIMLLVAIPLAAAVMGVAVVGAALAVVGTTPILRSRALVVLDQGARRAFARSFHLLFSSGDESRSLRFSRTADVYMTHGAEFRARGRWPWQTVLEYGERLAGRSGIYYPLVPAGVRIADVVDTPLRLEVAETAPGRIRVTNLLGASVDDLVVCDSAGRAYRTRALAEADTRELDELKDLSGGDFRCPDIWQGSAWSSRGAMRIDNSLTLKKMASSPSGAHYWAFMGESPFCPDILGGKKSRRKCGTIVVGVFGKESRE